MNNLEGVNKSKQRVLIKIGGSLLNNITAIEAVSFEIKQLQQAGIQIILVHGGSKAINQHLAIHQIESSFIDGLRVTSLAAMNIIEMILSGHINKLLVRKLNHLNMNAIGISGADAAILKCEPYSSVHGYAGKIVAVYPSAIEHLLTDQNADYIPVISPVGINEAGEAMNINADYAASHIAFALKADQLIYLTDQDGIYDQSGNIYPELTSVELETIIAEQIVMAGMLIKSKAILFALNHGFSRVNILNGNQSQVLTKVLLDNKNLGTVCKQNFHTHVLLETASC